MKKENGGYKTRDKYLAYHRNFQLHRHGITEEDFGWLVHVWQANMCALCLEEFTGTPHIDHAHSCDKPHPHDKGLHKYGCPFCIRGALCGTRNRYRILGIEFLADQEIFVHRYLGLRPILIRRQRDSSK